MDAIFEAFLAKQYADVRALADQSDILSVKALGDTAAPQKLILGFTCQTFVRTNMGEVCRAERRCVIGVFFPDDYLRRAQTFQVCTWLGPADVFHPNILPLAGAICVGSRFLLPGTPLVELCFQLFAMICWSKHAAASALNEAAAEWARGHAHLLPADSRPLKRRDRSFQVTVQNHSR